MMANDEEKEPKEKAGEVIRLRRKAPSMSQRKGPPEKIRASALAKATADGDSTSNFVPSVVIPCPTST